MYFFRKNKIKTKDNLIFENFTSPIINTVSLYRLYRTSNEYTIKQDFRPDLITMNITTHEDYIKVCALLSEKRFHIFDFHTGDTLIAPNVTDILKEYKKLNFKQETDLVEESSDVIEQTPQITTYNKYAQLIQDFTYKPIYSFLQYEQEANALYQKTLL